MQAGRRLPTRARRLLLGRARGRTNRDGMRETLERIRAVVEAPDTGS